MLNAPRRGQLTGQYSQKSEEPVKSLRRHRLRWPRVQILPCRSFLHFDSYDVGNGNISATRNQLKYLALPFAARPQFQHLLKIRHRLRWSRGAPNPVESVVSKKGRYAP